VVGSPHVAAGGAGATDGVLRTFIWMAVAFTTAAYTILFLDAPTVEALAGDERFVEMVGAASYAAAAVACFIAARRARAAGHARARTHVLLALGIVFFLACGEELSWGQHMLGFETPETLETVNRQAEFNLHNLNIWDSRDESGARKGGLGFFLNSNRFLDYFMFVMFVLGPWIVGRRDTVGRWARRLGAPRYGFAFALPLALNYALTAVALVATGGNVMSRATSEIREACSAFLCMSFAWWLAHAHARSERDREGLTRP
jgi:hypothetical protein